MPRREGGERGGREWEQLSLVNASAAGVNALVDTAVLADFRCSLVCPLKELPVCSRGPWS